MTKDGMTSFFIRVSIPLLDPVPGGAESQLDALSNGPNMASERCLDRRDCLCRSDGHGLH